MTILQAIIMSIVEGLTEFIPVSSTGHLILTSSILGIYPTDFVKSFEIAIQSGAIAAVVLLYFQKIQKNPHLMIPIAYAFIPTSIIGLVFYKFIKSVLLDSSIVTLVTLGIGGVFLMLFEHFFPLQKNHDRKPESLSPGQAIFIGFIQSLSVIPGVSRAAASIIGGMIAGLSRESAVEFSFLLAVPTVIAATVFDLAKSSYSFTSTEYGLLGIGFVGAFISALAAVKFFLSFVKRHTLTVFGIYRIFLVLLYSIWVYNLKFGV